MRTYKTDGASVVQLADVNPGPADSFYALYPPTPFHGVGARLVFSALVANQWVLHSTDGTEVVALNLDPGTAPVYSFVSFADELYFGAEGPNGAELFKTD